MKRSASAISLTKPAHHQGIARGRECVVVLLDEGTVFPEIQSVFFQPAVILTLKYFPASAAHSVVHLGNAGLDRHAAILKCCLLTHHVETGIAILTHEGNAGARQCLLPAIMRPGPAQAPRPNGIDMLQHRWFA